MNYSDDFIKAALKNALSKLQEKKVDTPVWRKLSVSITSYYIDNDGCFIDNPNYVLSLISCTGFTITHTFTFDDISRSKDLERLFYRKICSMISG